MPPPRIERGLQVPETCVISFSPRGRKLYGVTHSLARRQPDEPSGRTFGMLSSFRYRLLAPGKVNLNLSVVGVRPDGYHDLVSDMCPVSIWDHIVLEGAPARECRIQVECRPDSLPQGDQNLVYRAAVEFLAAVGGALDLRVSIDKGIPAGAGLGGGSSDAASCLVFLNRLCGFPLEGAELIRLATAIGADVPFFVRGRPARIGGIGEILGKLDYRPRSWIVVLFDGTHLSTARVFEEFDRSLTRQSDQSINRDAERPTQAGLHNQLESAACRIYPGIQSLKQQLTELGAVESRMTGSGSAVFGFFDGAPSAQFAAHSLRQRGLWARSAHVLHATPVAIG